MIQDRVAIKWRKPGETAFLHPECAVIYCSGTMITTVMQHPYGRAARVPSTNEFVQAISLVGVQDECAHCGIPLENAPVWLRVFWEETPKQKEEEHDKPER